MFIQLRCGRTFCRCLLNHPLDNLDQIIRIEFRQIRKVWILVENGIHQFGKVCGRFGLAFPWRMKGHYFIHDTAKCKDVHIVCVCFALKNFRCHVQRTSNHRFREVIFRFQFFAKSKIPELANPVVDQNIRWLDISMDDI